METKIERGFLLFSDITGYEKYLKESEIEHASQVVQELLELIINQNVPPLQFATVSGDGVLMHIPSILLQRPEVILELAESTYLSFKDRVESIDRNNTCGCRACSAAPNLDLKFFVHYGEYALHSSLDKRMDLVGTEAMLLKDRKLKDHVKNINEPFILFTHASLDKLKLQLTDAVQSSSEYPVYGEISTTRLNLSHRYRQLLDERRTFISSAEADIENSVEIAARPLEIWEWLNNPHLRTKWMRARTWTELKRPGGRLSIGAQNHCAHALGNIIETVLDWNPYAYFTSKTEEGKLQLIQTFELVPSSDLSTTTVHWRVKIASLPWRKITGLIAAPMIKSIYKQDLKFLSNFINSTNHTIST